MNDDGFSLPDSRFKPWQLADSGRQAHYVSFTISIPDLSLSNTIESTTDWFIMVAGDSGIDRAFVLFDQDVVGKGNMFMWLVADQNDGSMLVLTDNLNATSASTKPQEIKIQIERLPYGKAIYLRVNSKPASGITPWWATATRINVTLHLANPQ